MSENLNRHCSTDMPPPPLEETAAELKQAVEAIMRLLGEVAE